MEVTLDKLFPFPVSQFPHLRRVELGDHESLNQETSLVYQLGLGFAAAQSCAVGKNSVGTHIPPKEGTKGPEFISQGHGVIYAL